MENIIVNSNKILSTNFEKVQRCKQINLERLGETRINTQGETMFIVEYNGAYDVTVQFNKTGELVKCQYSQFKNGKVKCKLIPTVYGVGVVGLEEIKDDNGDIIDSYEYWHNMLRRCYDKKYQEKYPTYKDVFVCEEWLNYSNFKEWFEGNIYQINNEKMCLDKDILIKGNKIYSPKTCIFVPNSVNLLFTKNNKNRGNYPIGVSYNKNINKYESYCKVYSNGKSVKKHLGLFNTSKEAFNVYKIFKEQLIKQIADEYKDKIPKKLYDAMYNYIVSIDD